MILVHLSGVVGVIAQSGITPEIVSPWVNAHKRETILVKW